MNNPKIGCISLVPVVGGDRFVAIKCSKDRGVILPGGKWERSETFRQTAERELREETGLQASTQRLLFSSLAEDGYYVHTFLTAARGEILPGYTTDEGAVVFATWRDLFKSDYRAYYDLLREKYEEFQPCWGNL